MHEYEQLDVSRYVGKMIIDLHGASYVTSRDFPRVSYMVLCTYHAPAPTPLNLQAVRLLLVAFGPTTGSVQFPVYTP